MVFVDATLAEFRRIVQLHLEVLDEATRDRAFARTAGARQDDRQRLPTHDGGVESRSTNRRLLGNKDSGASTPKREPPSPARRSWNS